MSEIHSDDLNQRKSQGRSPVNRQLVLAGLGVGGMLAYLISRSRRAAKRRDSERHQNEGHDSSNVVDDRGTQQSQAAAILRNLRDRGFGASDEKVALALGRTAEEIQAFNSGLEVIDDDLIMKVRGIAMHRGISID